MEDEALDSRGRNVTLIVFGAIVVIIAGLVGNNYRIKLDRIAGMESADPARQAAKVREMAEGFTNDGAVAEQLQGERPSVRMSAVRALLALAQAPATDEKWRKNAAKLTVPFMKDSDQAIRDFAVQSLTAMGPETAIEAVTTALNDGDGNVKTGAQTVCQNFAPDSIPAILAFSGKDGVTARLRTTHRTFAGNAFHEISKKKTAPWNTVILFGEEAVGARQKGLTPEQAHAELKTFLGLQRDVLVPKDVRVFGVVDYLDPANGNEDDQNNAISILDRVGDARAVPYLIKNLATPTTRRAAVGALGRLADRRATLPLLGYLPQDETNRLEIVIALGRIADPRAIASLIKHGISSVSAPVRGAASDSLRSIGPPAEAALIQAATVPDPADPSYYKVEGAARALAGLRLPRATKVAISLLKHPADNVRQAAAGSLGDCGSPTAIAPLIASFTDRNGRVAELAARSVSAFGPQAVPRLVTALSDPKLAYFASSALRYIGAPALPALRREVVSGDPGGALAAAELLGDLGDVNGLPALKQALARRPDPDFTFAANSSIQRLSAGAPDAAPGAGEGEPPVEESGAS